MNKTDFKEGSQFLVGKSTIVNTVTNVFPEDIPGSGCFDVGLRTFGSNKSCNAEVKGKRIRLYDTLGPVFGTAFTRWMPLAELHLLPEPTSLEENKKPSDSISNKCDEKV